MIALLAALLAIVPVTNNSVSYACNGSTATFTINFPYIVNTDLVVTDTTTAGAVATLVPVTDWTVNYATLQAGSAILTLNAPASTCPSGSTLKIANSPTATQPFSFRAQTQYNTALHEQAYDREMMVIQGLANTTAGPTSTGLLTSIDWTRFNSSQGASVNALAMGAKADGVTNDAAAITSALAISQNTVVMPASAACYNLGTTGLTIPQGRNLVGAGMGGASNGPTCLTYSGAGCAITLESVSYSGVRDLDLQVSSTTGSGLCIKATTGVSEFNQISSVSIRMTNATRRNAGQVGLYLNDTGNGVYWNSFSGIRLAYWDVATELSGGATQGANANSLIDFMSWGHNTALRMIATGGGFAADNVVNGFRCSRSDGSFAGTTTCFLLGDDGTKALENYLFGIVSDQGAPSVCGTIGFGSGSNAGGNTVFADCESGGAVTDNNTGLPNTIFEPIAGSSPGRLRIARLAASVEVDVGSGILASTGDVRNSNNRLYAWRNVGNTADITGIYVDTNDREKLGSNAAFLRLDNAAIEHGTGTVSTTGGDRFVHNWSSKGRNSGNSADRNLWSWGAATDTLILGDNAATAQVAAPTTFTSVQNSGTITLSAGTGTATVPSGSHCVCSDTTAANACKPTVVSTTLTIAGTGTDVIAYLCF